MPFKSEKQRKFLHAKHPEVAQKWEREAKKSGKSTPRKKGKK